MFQRSVFLTTLLIGSLIADPQIVWLNTLQNGTTTIGNVENGAHLYLASSDNNEILESIVIMTPGGPIPLNALAASNFDGSTPKVTVNAGLYYTSSVPNDVMETLTGYLYITTAEQANDGQFYVHVISDTHQIYSDDTYSLTVILNKKLKTDSKESDLPDATTYVTALKSRRDTELFFNEDIPPTDYNKNGFQKVFFWNPIPMTGNYGMVTKIHYENVEPLQINLPYWYITAAGPFSATMQNKYDTTGLIMVHNKPFYNYIVNFQLDPQHQRTTGTLVRPYINKNVVVSETFFENADSVGTRNYNSSSVPTSTTYYLAPYGKLVITSTKLLIGRFYCQYFGYRKFLLVRRESFRTLGNELLPWTQPTESILGMEAAPPVDSSTDLCACSSP